MVHRTLATPHLRAIALPLCAAVLTACSSVDTATPGAPAAQRLPAKRGEMIVQGYLPDWELKQFAPEQLALHQLTHVSHAFVAPTRDGHLKVPDNFQAERVVRAARRAGAKPLLCIGGADTDIFRQMAVLPLYRARFVRETALFAHRNGYGGIEVDWEFPKTDVDRAGLVALMAEFRQVCGPKCQLNVVVGGSKYVGDAVDVEHLRHIVDYFVIMSYDYHGKWSDFSGYNAPLRPYAKSNGSVAEGVEYWLDRGVPRDRMIMGLPFYGRSFDAAGAGLPFRESRSYLYRDIPALRALGVQRYWDGAAEVPYLRRVDHGWMLSYDDARSLDLKVRYARERGLAGVMIWQITADVINGRHALLPAVTLAAQR